MAGGWSRLGADTDTAMPLADVRILSFGSFVAGNICALMLAELGADVVKVEVRERPEALRAYDTPEQAQIFEPSGIRTTALFAGMTRSLRSAAIDMTSEAGRETFRRLVEHAEVVVENLGPGHDGVVGVLVRRAEDAQSAPGHAVDLGLRPVRTAGELPGLRVEHQQLPRSDVRLGTRRDPLRLRRRVSTAHAPSSPLWPRSTGVRPVSSSTWRRPRPVPPSWPPSTSNSSPTVANGAPGPTRCRDPTSPGCCGVSVPTPGWPSSSRTPTTGRSCARSSRDPIWSSTGAGPTPELRESLRQALEEWAGTVSAFQATLGVAEGRARGRRRAGQRGPVARPTTSQSLCLRRGLVTPTSGASNTRTLRVGASGGCSPRGPRLGEHTAGVLGEWLACGEEELGELRESRRDLDARSHGRPAPTLNVRSNRRMLHAWDQ